MIITIIVLIIVAAIIGGGIWLGVYLHKYYKEAEKVVNNIGNTANNISNGINNVTEGFTSENNNGLPRNDQDALQDQENTLLGRSPESTYKFRNYYLQREPVEAQVVKHEVSHEFPSGVLYSDMVMSTNNKIRFSDDVDGPDNFRLKLSDDKNNLHLFMKDRPGNNNQNKFIIRGKGCVEGNCNTSSMDLHVFSDEPHYAIRKVGGGDVHKFSSNGDAMHTGKLKVGNNAEPKHILDGSTGNQYTRGTLNSNMVNVRNKLFFSATPHNVDPSAVSSRGPHHDSDPFWMEKINHGTNKNSLRMVINDDANDRFQIYGGRAYFGKKEGKPLVQVTGKGNLWTRDTTNTKDLNVRGRIYFSNASPDGGDDINEIIDPQDKNFNANKWGSIHDTDPYWIEKVGSADNNSLRITINDNHNESIQIFANSCAQKNPDGTHRCVDGEGNMIFKIDASGRVDITGPGASLYVNNTKVA